jgi:AcrR family transcriptional regulator
MVAAKKSAGDADGRERPALGGSGDDRRTDVRERLLAAVVRILAGSGYAGLDSASVSTEAGLSAADFDATFQDRRAAVEAAHEAVFERFRNHILEACGAQADWPLKVKVAVAAALDFAAAAPDQTQLLVLDAILSDRDLARRTAAARDQLAALLAGGRRQLGARVGLPTVTEQLLIAGLAGTISHQLIHGEAKRLPELAPQLVQFTLLPYLGPDEAARVASRPRPEVGR